MKTEILQAAALVEASRRHVVAPEPYALDDRGRVVSHDSPAATSFCVMGALLRVGLSLAETRDTMRELSAFTVDAFGAPLNRLMPRTVEIIDVQRGPDGQRIAAEIMRAFAVR